MASSIHKIYQFELEADKQLQALIKNERMRQILVNNHHFSDILFKTVHSTVKNHDLDKTRRFHNY